MSSSAGHWAIFSVFITWAVHLVLLKAQFQQVWRQALSLMRWGRHSGNCIKVQFFQFLKLSPNTSLKKKYYPPLLTAVVCGKGSHYLSTFLPLCFRLPMLPCLISGLPWPLRHELRIQGFNPGHAQEEKHRKCSDHSSSCCVCSDALKDSDLRGSVERISEQDMHGDLRSAFGSLHLDVPKGYLSTAPRE